MKFIILTILLMSSFASASDCIFTSRIRSFNSNYPTEVRIDAGRDQYMMNVSYCRNLPYARRIAFKSFSSSRVCRGDRLLVLDNYSNRVIEDCYIHDIRRW